METDNNKESLPYVFSWQELISEASGGYSFKIGFSPKGYSTKVLTFDDRFELKFKDFDGELVEAEFSGSTAKEAESKFIDFFVKRGECMITMPEGKYNLRIVLNLSYGWVIEKIPF